MILAKIKAELILTGPRINMDNPILKQNFNFFLVSMRTCNLPVKTTIFKLDRLSRSRGAPKGIG